MLMNANRMEVLVKEAAERVGKAIDGDQILTLALEGVCEDVNATMRKDTFGGSNADISTDVPSLLQDVCVAVAHSMMSALITGAERHCEVEHIKEILDLIQNCGAAICGELEFYFRAQGVAK